MTTNGQTVGLRGSSPAYDYATFKKPVISGLGATRTLVDSESNSVIMLDRNGGTTITLPVAKPGMSYEFISNITNTTAHVIITNITTTTPVILGAVEIIPAVAGTSSGFANAGSAYSLSLNGGTTGGMAGSRLVLTALSSGTWSVSGLIVGTGSLATPFV